MLHSLYFKSRRLLSRTGCLQPDFQDFQVVTFEASNVPQKHDSTLPSSSAPGSEAAQSDPASASTAVLMYQNVSGDRAEPCPVADPPVGSAGAIALGQTLQSEPYDIAQIRSKAGN